MVGGFFYLEKAYTHIQATEDSGLRTKRDFYTYTGLFLGVRHSIKALMNKY